MTLQRISVRRLVGVILICFILLSVAIIFDSIGSGRRTYTLMDMIETNSIDQEILTSTPNFQNSPQEAISTLSQSRWSCKNKTAIVDRNLDCRRRLPHVIGIGAKKCGTSAVNFFLSSHPAMMIKNPLEPHQWDWHPLRSMDKYRRLMPITSQYQITMEKTPAYFVADDIPAAIARDVSPDIKLLLILRDPVKRAISDYVHVLDTFPQMALSQREGATRKGRTPVYPQANISYVIKDTFEKSVLNEDGTVNSDNAIIYTGMFSRHLRNWLKIFSREQIHVVDGDLFIKHPLSPLRHMEEFLGLPNYFDADKLYFDKAKGFYCLALPSKHCMGSGKGRTHPNVDEDTLKKLYTFYEPYDKELKILTGRTFSWMKSD